MNNKITTSEKFISSLIEHLTQKIQSIRSTTITVGDSSEPNEFLAQISQLKDLVFRINILIPNYPSPKKILNLIQSEIIQLQNDDSISYNQNQPEINDAVIKTLNEVVDFISQSQTLKKSTNYISPK